MRKIIFSHPTGNAFVRAAAGSFLQAGHLQRFFTTLAAFDGSLLHRLGNFHLLSDVQRRSYSKYLLPVTVTQPFYETGRLIAAKLGLAGLIKHETGLFSVDNVYRKLDNQVANSLKKLVEQGADTVYCYEDGAYNTFSTAKDHHLTCLYDLPIGYWRTMHRMLGVEKALHPAWAPTITGFYDSKQKLAHKDAELAMADHIFVASSFTAATLKDYPGKMPPVSIIPYGFPDVTPGKTYRVLKSNQPLHILFVGQLSQRKGIANLLEAVAPFGKKVELTIVGERVIKNCQPLNEALTRHRWISSLSQKEILQLMRQQDLLIFPSLFEGFGMVITEAMSQGTPVITTERTAGPDMIVHGENGWLVEAGSTEQLQAAISNILERPAQLEKVGKAAMEAARQRPWSVYGDELVQLVNKL